MIQLSGVSLNYKDEKALDNLSLNIKKGELVSVLGPSGSGKTSLISLIGGIKEASSGNIKLDTDKSKVAIIFQNYGLLPWKTVYDNVIFTLKIRKEANAEVRVDELLDKLGLLKYKDRYPHQLSGGQAQRVAIARALALDVKILLMDEAFSALDSLTKESLQKLLLSIQNDLTIVFVTHNIEEAIYLGSRIIVMDNGKIKAEFDNPQQGNRNSQEYFLKCQEVREVLHD